jgi:hypothetical protein
VKNFLHVAQTVLGTHSASYPIVAGRGVKQLDREADYLTQTSVSGQETNLVELSTIQQATSCVANYGTQRFITAFTRAQHLPLS